MATTGSSSGLIILRQRCGCAGFSLIELAMAMAIGALMTLALATLFNAGTRQQAAQLAQQRAIERSLISADYLSNHLRLAGRGGHPPIDDSGTADDGFDRVAIRYHHPANNNCLGEDQPQPTRDRFGLRAGVGGENGLNCNGLEIVDGIDDLQILYGEDINDDGVIDRYLPWSAAVQANRVLGLTLRYQVKTSYRGAMAHFPATTAVAFRNR